MKTLKQIREEIEVNEAEDKKLTTLIRAGLFDVRKLPLLKRALSKDNTKMSPTERNSLLDLLDTLIAHVTGDAGVYTKVRHNVMHEDINETYEVAGELPMILILKRRSIRAFPDGQRVALYWADKLKTFISVPYSSVGVGYSPSVSEEVTLVAEEPIEELSTKKLQNYVYKATDSVVDNDDETFKNDKKRLTGLKLADKKLTARGLKQKNGLTYAKEDDVQELDKKTLVSYANKAHTDRDWQKRDSALYLKAANSADSKDRPDIVSQRISHAISADKNVKKRTAGIELANKKIAKIESKPKKLGEDDVEEAKKETSFWDDADRGKESLRKADAKSAEKQKKSNAKLFNKVANRKDVKETLEDIVNENAQKILNFDDGGSTTIGPFTASAILEVYNAINDDNKAKMKASLNESRVAFNKMAEFALSKV